MNIYTKAVFVFVLLFSAASSAQAWDLQLKEPLGPYQVQMIEDDITTESQYLNTLNGAPQLYQFVVEEDTTLKLQLSQLASESPIPLALIVVKENKQRPGVIEVGRMNTDVNTWEKKRESTLGLTFLNSETLTADIGPGTYRIEVNADDNKGLYMLTAGEEDNSAGYFNTISTAWQIQQFFGKSFLAIFTSSYLYYPLGSLLILGLLFLTWRNRSLIKSPHA